MNKWLKVAHYVVVSLVAGGFAIPLINGEGLNGVTIIAALGAIAVYITKNTPTQPWARTLAAVYVTAIGALVAAATTDEGGLAGFGAVSSAEWQQIAFLALGGAAVLSSSDETGPVPVPSVPAQLPTRSDDLVDLSDRDREDGEDVPSSPHVEPYGP